MWVSKMFAPPPKAEGAGKGVGKGDLGGVDAEAEIKMGMAKDESGGGDRERLDSGAF